MHGGDFYQSICRACCELQYFCFYLQYDLFALFTFLFNLTKIGIVNLAIGWLVGWLVNSLEDRDLTL